MFRIATLLAASALLAHSQSAAFRWIRQIGGSGAQSLAGIAVDSQGNTWAAGSTTSLDFPVVNAVQPHPAGSGVYRIDGPGANWQSLYQSGLIAAGVVTTDPRDPRTVYAASASEIRRSSDSGATWSSVADLGVGNITGLAIDPSDGRILYAATQGRGLLKSTDAGATWNSSDHSADRGVWIDPNHPAVIFTVSFTSDNYVLYRSADGGASWQSTGFAGISTIAFDPFTPGKVYASNIVRSAVSTDDGLTWTPLGRVDDPYWQPYVILPDPLHPGVLYGGSQNTLWKTDDGGTTWTRKVPSPASLLTVDSSTGAIYAAFGYHVVVTTDGFDTVTSLGPPSVVVTSLAASGGHVFAGAQASSDVFVAKFDPQGNILFATYFGGSASDLARAIAVDPAGAVYVTGTTQSQDFPVTPGAFAKTGASFVFKLNPDGSLGWSTYFAAQPNAIAVDAAGHAYIAGVTAGQIPTTPGAYQTQFNGSYCGVGCLISIPPSNGFLTGFAANGNSLILSTLIGVQREAAIAVGFFGDGSILVGGEFTLYHLDPTGSALLGQKSPVADMRSITPDGAGNLLVAGGSPLNSQSAGVTATPGAFQPSPYPGLSLPGTLGNTGLGDAVVLRIDSQLNVLGSTYLGGEAPDMAQSAAAAPDGSIIVGGSTYSNAFPTRGALQSAFSRTTGFVSQLSGDFSLLLFSTYTGDSRPFYVRSVATTADGGIIFGGTTSNPPFLSTGGLSVYADNGLFPNTGYQAFVVRIDREQAAAPRIDSVVNAASQLAVALSPGETVQVRGAGFGNDAALYVNGHSLPLLARDAAMLTAAIPSDFTGSVATVEVRSASGSATIAVPAAPASPGVFSQDGTGIRNGYILNKDGTLNSRDNPAKEGDPVTICATGVGTMTFDRGYAVTDSPVEVRIDGFFASGIAAILGPVQGLPGDVYQISVYLPRPSDFAAANPNLKDFVMPPTVAVTLAVNGGVSQAGVALWVTH